MYVHGIRIHGGWSKRMDRVHTREQRAGDCLLWALYRQAYILGRNKPSYSASESLWESGLWTTYCPQRKCAIENARKRIPVRNSIWCLVGTLHWGLGTLYPVRYERDCFPPRYHCCLQPSPVLLYRSNPSYPDSNHPNYAKLPTEPHKLVYILRPPRAAVRDTTAGLAVYAIDHMDFVHWLSWSVPGHSSA